MIRTTQRAGPESVSTRWLRWALGLTLVVAVPFVAAYVLASRVPPEGDARLETLVSGLVTAGAAAAGGVVTFAAAGWALSEERRRSATERYRVHQADLTRDAADWLRRMSRGLGGLYGERVAVVNAVNDDARVFAQHVEREAARRFGENQGLDDVARLAVLIDNAEVANALAEADDLIRGWNEWVSPEACGGGEVNPASVEDPLLLFGRISELHKQVEAALADSVRHSWT